MLGEAMQRSQFLTSTSASDTGSAASPAQTIRPAAAESLSLLTWEATQ